MYIYFHQSFSVITIRYLKILKYSIKKIPIFFVLCEIRIQNANSFGDG